MDRVLRLRLEMAHGEAVLLLGLVAEKVQQVEYLRSVLPAPPPDGLGVWARLAGKVSQAIIRAREDGGRVLTVLVIEDNRPVRELLALTLELSYQVMSAGDGASGLILAGLIKPDLILLDLGLPDMHGLEVLRELRADADLERVPVLILSGQSADQARPALAMGANGYVTKPYSPAYLLDRIGALLGSYDLHERIQ